MMLQRRTSGSAVVLSLLLLLLSAPPLLPHRVSPSAGAALNLRRFIGCAVREFTFWAKKPGCSGLHITTDACWGRCETWEKPIVDPPFVESHQKVCTYNSTRLISVRLSNCEPHVDPVYTYAQALSCECGSCVTRTTECITSV